jgi:hypothetical protein
MRWVDMADEDDDVGNPWSSAKEAHAERSQPVDNGAGMANLMEWEPVHEDRRDREPQHLKQINFLNQRVKEVEEEEVEEITIYTYVIV